MLCSKSVRMCCLLSASAFFSGCAFSPNDEFTRFSPEEFGAQQVLIVVDTLKLDDVDGDLHVLNINVNQQVADALLNAASKQMAAKGYSVSPDSVQSSGLMVNTASQYLVIERGSEDDGKTDWDDTGIGSIESAPYFIDLGPLTEDAMLPLNEVHRNILSTQVKSFKDIGPLGLQRLELDFYSGVLVMQGYGVDIPFGKSMAQGMATALVTLGMVSTWQQPTSNYSATLIDPASGQVVWANHFYQTSVMRRPEQIETIVETLLRDLPMRSVAGQGEIDLAEESSL